MNCSWGEHYICSWQCCSHADAPCSGETCLWQDSAASRTPRRRQRAALGQQPVCLLLPRLWQHAPAYVHNYTQGPRCLHRQGPWYISNTELPAGSKCAWPETKQTGQAWPGQTAHSSRGCLTAMSAFQGRQQAIRLTATCLPLPAMRDCCARTACTTSSKALRWSKPSRVPDTASPARSEGPARTCLALRHQESHCATAPASRFELNERGRCACILGPAYTIEGAVPGGSQGVRPSVTIKRA